MHARDCWVEPAMVCILGHTTPREIVHYCWWEPCLQQLACMHWHFIALLTQPRSRLVQFRPIHRGCVDAIACMLYGFRTRYCTSNIAHETIRHDLREGKETTMAFRSIGCMNGVTWFMKLLFTACKFLRRMSLICCFEWRTQRLYNSVTNS